MEIENEGIRQIKFIRELCLGKSEKEIIEAEENFREYMLVIRDISARLDFESNSDGFDGRKSI